MINLWTDRNQNNHSNCFTKKISLSFIINIFKRKKKKRPNEGDEREIRVGSQSECDLRILSPAMSTLTLTPGRTRDIDQDMEALRLSRQDNPFLQVIASRESLVDSIYESEVDYTNLMAEVVNSEPMIDPLSLPEIHEHMIRSPPPTTWPKSPNFKMFTFPEDFDEEVKQRSSSNDSRRLDKRYFGTIPHLRSVSESRCKPTIAQFGSRFPVRSLSDVRRTPNTLQLFNCQ